MIKDLINRRNELILSKYSNKYKFKKFNNEFIN